MPHYFACPAYPEQQQQQQQQQRNISALDPFLQAIFSQLQHPEETESPATSEKPAPQRKPSRPTATPRNHNRTNRAFSPRFDVYETEDAYHLFGDLPGVSDKKSIGIEFSDPRTLMVSGRVERSMPKPQKQFEQKQSEEQPVEEKRRSLNPTVEDTDDEDDYSVVSAAATTTSTTTLEKEEHKEEEQQQQEEKRKVWLTERTFGTFQRTFSFPTPVALEDVSAKLDNGLLQIVVPKVRFGGVRRIEVD